MGWQSREVTYTTLGEVGHALGRDHGRGGGDEGSIVLHCGGGEMNDRLSDVR